MPVLPGRAGSATDDKRRVVPKLAAAAIVLASLLALVSSASHGDAAVGRHASGLCVGSGRGCYATVQEAVSAAGDGDTVTIGPGRFAGGVTIDTSIELVGAGAEATIIDGGGPVLSIGVAGAATEPTVTVDGVTVTGGVTVGNLSPANGRGGGIYIPRAAGPSTGATVAIRRSVIRGNMVAPSGSVDSGVPCPGGGDCPFASAGGGGISSDGNLTLIDTVVTGNRAGAAAGLTSDADGAGILNRAFGNLTLKHVTVTDNHAAASAPNGRFADGGGILMVGGTMTIDDSLVSGNSVEVTTAFTADVETSAGSAGVHSEADTTATVRNTTIADNTSIARNTVGDAVSVCAGFCVDGSLDLRDSTIRDNAVRATATAPGATALADSAALGLGCCRDDPKTVSIVGVRLTGNSVAAAAPAGVAIATAGAIGAANAPAPSVRDTVISGNRATAISMTGSAVVRGVGVENAGLLELRNTTVSDNTGTAIAPTGVAEGAGIWNGPFVPPPAGPELTLLGSTVRGNRLVASPGIVRRGGGLFTTVRVTLRDSLLTRNSPDDCFGC